MDVKVFVELFLVILTLMYDLEPSAAMTFDRVSKCSLLMPIKEHYWLAVTRENHGCVLLCKIGYVYYCLVSTNK